MIYLVNLNHTSVVKLDFLSLLSVWYESVIKERRKLLKTTQKQCLH